MSDPSSCFDINHGVSIEVQPNAVGCLAFRASYTDYVLDESSALIMLKQMEDIMSFILENPDEPTDSSFLAVRIPLLSASNEEMMEVEDLEEESKGLHRQFEEYARHSPDRVALIFERHLDTSDRSGHVSWTYGQLDEKAQQVADHLIYKFGPLDNTIVPICMDRRPELYVAILGVLKAGGAWSPIDPSFPTRRRHDLIARTYAKIMIVAEQRIAGDRDGIPENVMTIDITNIEKPPSSHGQTPKLKSCSLAYLIWTSGTTGDPKGVPISHGAAVASMKAIQGSIPTNVIGDSVRCLQFSQFTFDVFVQDLFYTWGVGGTLIASTKQIMLGSFAQLVNSTKATHAHLTPAFGASIERKLCPTLQVITMIGEKLTQSVADDWSQDIRAFNTYGPAETTVVSTLRQFGMPGDEMNSHNVGYPLSSVSAFVMRGKHPVMRQGIGELALGGPQLSQGYWHDIQKSSDRFVWNKRYGRYLYMTGDIVRQLHDGSLEFVGRDDDLIKIQGIRIELSEIAFSLRSCHSLVEQVDIQYLARQDRPSKVLVAFLSAPRLCRNGEFGTYPIANDDAIQISRAAFEEAKKTLPEYMNPSVFIVISNIPRTSSAKIDRAALKDIYHTVDLGRWERQLAAGDGEEVSWKQHESYTIQTIAKVSGTHYAAIHRSSTLTSIGIDSIRVTRLVSLLNLEGRSLSVIDVLRCQNIADLLASIEQATFTPLKNAYPLADFHEHWWPKVQAKLGGQGAYIVPTLPIQESLLSETMKDPNAYWSNAVFDLDTNIDLQRMRIAWLRVASNTEALRSAFIPLAECAQDVDSTSSPKDAFLQLIYKQPLLDWETIHSGETSVEDQAGQRVKELIKKHQDTHFRNPLWAITILEQPDHYEMIVSIHHAIRDEPSLDHILTDVYHAYHGGDGNIIQRHQLTQALEVLLPTNHQIDEDEKYWSSVINEHADQETNAWPDLTGKRAIERVGNTGFTTQTKQVSTPYEDLRSTAMSLGASSVASLFRLAWGLVLLEYLEAESLVFGETNSDRIKFPALQDTIGPFINVMPVPFKARGSIRELLVAQSKLQSQSREHRSVHPRTIRKILQRPQDAVLYPAIFNYLPEISQENDGEASQPWRKLDDLTKLTVEHPVALNVLQLPNGNLHLEIAASETVMSQSHAMLLARQVEAVVDAMIKWPDIPAKDITSKLPKHLLSISSVVPSEAVALAPHRDPVHWVDHFATEHPDWLAAKSIHSLEDAESTGDTWTFRQLCEKSNRVAAFLHRDNRRGDMIAMCLDHRLEAYAVMLGILKSGNTYLPIDQSLPKERKTFLLEDSAATVLITISQLASEFPNSSSRSRVVLIDHENILDDALDDIPSNPSPPLHREENAYLLYTSGSTGAPKGVLVGRGNLSSFVEGLSEYIWPLTPDFGRLPGQGRYLGLASRAFDVHLAETFLAWRRGMAVVTAPRAVLLDDLETALRKLKITHASFVPSLIEHAGLDPDKLPGLRYLGIGGEKMSQMVIDIWASNKNVCIVNPYGPTELSIGCCAVEVTQRSNARNVGRPFGNSVAHILNPGTNTPTMRGIPGELCMTGDLVANGYHNRPDTKGFIEDFHGSRMYRTGDIVRLMADDSVEFIGRQDDQTKIRGQRLELGEVSGVIHNFATKELDLPNPNVATLVIQHSESSRPQLVTFVVPDRYFSHPQDSLDILDSPDERHLGASIRAHCQEKLPTYMVPDVVALLTAIPIAPSSGKADVKKLKALFSDIPLARIMSHSSQGMSNGTEAPKNELSTAERAVQDVISKTLGVPRSGLSHDSNLFQCGLDSLGAISLAIRLQKLGYVCSVTDILNNSNLSSLAAMPRNSRTDDSLFKYEEARNDIAKLEARFRASPHALDDSSISAIRPCLPLQESLVASSLGESDNPLYVNHISFNLSDDIDPTRLFKAWESIIADQEILRTCFLEFENRFVQIVLRLDGIRSSNYWKIVEHSTSDVASYRSQLSKDIISNISTEAPLRLVLVKSLTSNKNSTLLLSIHHALYDGESLRMLLEEVHRRYTSTSSPLLRTPFSRLLEHVSAQDLNKSRKFWMDYLAGYNPSASIRGAGNENTIAAMSLEVQLASKLSEVTDLASSFNCTAASVIQAVFGICLAQTLEISDIVFGTVLSGRTVPIENPDTILAPCTTTIPQRVILRSVHSSFIDAIANAQHGFTRSLDFQHTALRDIHRWAGADKPLFQCLFSYIRKLETSDQSDLWTENESSMPAEFPFAMEVQADLRKDELVANCNYTSAFGNSDRAEAFIKQMDKLLAALISREDLSSILPRDSHIANAKSALGAPPLDDIPESTEEQQVKDTVSIICDIKESDISRRASFFSLGIDSIIAIRFARELRQAGMQCSSADVMRYPSIAALTQHINARPPVQIDGTHEGTVRAGESSVHGSTRSPDNSDPATYLCTPLQSSMLTQTLGSDGKLYANHHAFRLSSSIFVDRLKRSWATLVQQTEILRSTFHFSKNQSIWRATVHDKPLKYSDSWTTVTDNTSISNLWSEVIDRFSFREDTDFDTQPWRVTILKSPSETVFVLSIHHSLYDGESMKLLINDFARVYRNDLCIQRPPFSSAAREISSSSTEAEAFWAKQLDDFENTMVPQDSEPAGIASVEVETTIAMDSQAILRRCKELGVTLQTAALLAYGKTLAYILKTHDIVFGHLVGGRSLGVPAAEDIVGPLFNTVPFRLKFNKANITISDSLDGIQRFSGESLAYHHASLGKVQQMWRQKSGDTVGRLFDNLFVFQRTTKEGEERPIMMEHLNIDSVAAPTEYSSNFEFEQTDDRILIRMIARQSRKYVSDWLASFQDIFVDVIQNSHESLLAFPSSFKNKTHICARVGDKGETSVQEDISPGSDLDGLRSVLSEVSGMSSDSIQQSTSIFALGLDSIATIQVASLCRKKGLNTGVADVLQGQTLAGICRRLRAKSVEPTVPPTSSGTLVSEKSKLRALEIIDVPGELVEDVLPCLSGQIYHLAMWLKSSRTICEATFSYRCSQKIDVDKLRLAWTRLRDQRPILRTCLVAVSEQEVIQLVLNQSSSSDNALRTLDVPDPLEDKTLDLVKKSTREPFDLFTVPARLTLVQGSSKDHILLKIHHSLYDVSTIETLIHDLELLYQKVSPPTLPALRHFISHTTHTQTTPSRKAFWLKSLPNTKPTILRSLTTTSPAANSTPTSLLLRAAVPYLSTLEASTRVLSLRLPTIILLAYVRVLAQHKNETSPTVGLFQTGRSSGFDGVDRICAPLLNVTPLQVPDVLSMKPIDAARALQDDLAERVAFEQSSLRDVLRFIRDEEDGNGMVDEGPLFNCYANILWQDAPTPKSTGEKDLFTPCHLGSSSDFLLPKDEIAPAKTAVDALDTSFLADENLFLDISRDGSGDAIDIGVRCDAGVMDEAQVREFVSEIVEELRLVIEQMEEKERE
ncbi:nonribosomal peptide synthetase sidC [Physcia stellaris]|nr:nonribosomal peptide synthetase sidC [Physcia stellaris]